MGYYHCGAILSIPHLKASFESFYFSHEKLELLKGTVYLRHWEIKVVLDIRQRWWVVLGRL